MKKEEIAAHCSTTVQIESVLPFLKISKQTQH
jgi:hypothetical protein